jgi:hypothetical protein
MKEIDFGKIDPGREVANHPGRAEERERLGDVPASQYCSESVLSLER